ncbi:MAG TPA: class I SAM-dependent methyltransferase [Puia sp.]|jgi:2-polyprenyl-3-methyl-5-hydroxy-6-metoxy-1,4-benzoquinol methylase|nr:class I SAM-dependent methyltransferase [Puia sp.]
MDSEYLKKYYNLERAHWWFRVREKIFRQQLTQSLPGDKELKILNVGAATGRTTEMLADFGAVTSVEFDHDTCEFLRAKLNMEVTEASVTALPFADQRFDVICAFDVLEHVQSDEQAIKELSRVCKSNGLIYLSCPAYSFLWSDHDRINHHYRRYTSRSLEKLVQREFQLQYMTYFNSILFLPIAGYRLIQRIFPRKEVIQSDFADHGLLSKKWLNWVFETTFNTEVLLLRSIKFPFGISILVRAVKE